MLTIKVNLNGSCMLWFLAFMFWPLMSWLFYVNTRNNNLVLVMENPYKIDRRSNDIDKKFDTTLLSTFVNLLPLLRRERKKSSVYVVRGKRKYNKHQTNRHKSLTKLTQLVLPNHIRKTIEQ